jgi:transcriptional regulator with XRE-family HTH domain
MAKKHTSGSPGRIAPGDTIIARRRRNQDDRHLSSSLFGSRPVVGRMTTAKSGRWADPGCSTPSSYDRVMTQPHDVEKLPSPSAALLQLARLKADMSQRELAERAGVPITMISAYERDLRQPTLTTLLRLLHAAGFDLRLHLAAYDTHDDVLAELEAGRSESERQRRDRQLQAWRQATSAEDVA